MAEEKKQESSGLTSAVPVTVVLAMLAGLFFTNLSPYQDERPSARPLQARYAAVQDVDARLWQDPFAAVDGASEDTPTENASIGISLNGQTLRLEKPKQTANSSSHTQNQIYKGNPVAAGDDFTILAVTLPGGPYQEASENRMRRRYAVLSALANQDAVPQDEQHIGYFHPADKPDMGLQKKVSFEWWSLPDDKKVLLLWVDESSLLGCPAVKLKELLRQASQEKMPEEITSHFAVIGPNTSTLLRGMLKEVEDVKNSDLDTKCAGKTPFKPILGEINGLDIAYYSAGATASDKRLLEALKQTRVGETVSGYLRDQGLTLYRTTATDVAMMDILATELDVRKVEKPDHVVILSEWDTFYGRAMPEAFEQAWDPKKQFKKDETVHIYGYMRGLDGKLPDKGDKTANAAEKKSDNKDKSDTDALIELPEGQNQKDYLRRLADSILELDQDLKDKDNKKGVAAIGVLGSDVHDKMMILEALRQHFPHKLFFTTDLDAAYSHRAKWPETHNMLVASAFDLKLRPELQGKIPTFRDSYQTAFFLAAQMVLNDEKFMSDQILNRWFERALGEQFTHKQFFITDPVAAYSHQAKWLQAPCQLKEGRCIVDQIGIPLPRLFEIGRSRPIPLPTSWDTVSVKDRDDSNKPKCSRINNWSACIVELIGKLHSYPRQFETWLSHPEKSSINEDTISPRYKADGNMLECSWTNLPACNTVQPRIFATSQLNWTWGGLMAIVIVAIILYIVSWRVRERVVQFTIGVVSVLFVAYCLTWFFPPPQLHWKWGVLMVAILCSFVRWWVLKREREMSFKLHPYFALGVGMVLFLAYSHTPLWNDYIIQPDAEPLHWLEGVSIWPSQLLRLSIFVFASGFFFWMRGKIKKTQDDLQLPISGETPPTFSLPTEQATLERCKVLFVGSWEEDKKVETASPDDLWKKYLGYCHQHKEIGLPDWFLRVIDKLAASNLWKKYPGDRQNIIGLPGSFLRVMMHGVAFLLLAMLLMTQSDLPNVPARGDFAEGVNRLILFLAVFSTIFLTMWVVEHARLCQRLISHLSAKPSRWNKKARDWAIRDKKVAPECVNDWLDIQLVVRLTEAIQPLIFGPVVCIAMLVLARSPAIDDWDIPWGLALVLITMLLYAISSEVWLQRGAKSARTKAIKLLSEKISAQRNLNRPDEVVIKRIEDEVERISALREGAFRPWYELPLLQSFGGLGTLLVALQYLAGVWERGSF